MNLKIFEDVHLSEAILRAVRDEGYRQSSFCDEILMVREIEKLIQGKIPRVGVSTRPVQWRRISSISRFGSGGRSGRFNR